MTAILSPTGYQSLTEGQSWSCPECTTVNSPENLNCNVCYKGTNPHKGRTTDFAQELLAQQRKSISKAENKTLGRTKADKFLQFFKGFRCPVCTTQISGFQSLESRCPSCDLPLRVSADVSKSNHVSPEKKSTQSNRSSRFFGLLKFNKANSMPNLESPVDSQQKVSRSSEKYCMISKNGEELDSATISPSYFEEGRTIHDGRKSASPCRGSPARSIDSGNCTMSDTTSQVSQIDSTVQNKRLSTDSETEHREQQTWQCSVCTAFNIFSPDQKKCYVCEVGVVPKELMPSKLQPFDDTTYSRQAMEEVNNQTRNFSTPCTEATTVPLRNGSNQPQQIFDRQPLYHAVRPSQRTGRHNRPTKLVTTRHTKTRTISRSEEEPTTPTPTKNCTQLMEYTRREDFHKANDTYEGIKRYCLKNKEPFVDSDFPPLNKSLYADLKKPATQWRVDKWRRPNEIVDPHASPKTKWAVLRNPDPGDIAQGVLGNCWVLSALSVIAEVPELIEKIMVTQVYSEAVGAYQVRLCKDGVWVTTVVDDLLPCFSNKELVFSKAHRKQLWVPLIEKAIAKQYGSYEALNSGRVLDGLSLLTGLPCEKIYLKKVSDSDPEVDHDLVWAQLLSFRELGFPMGASCGGFNINDEDYYRVGLEPNHAYSILDVLPLVLDGQLHRLVRLRNPWAKASWTGPWCDGDPRWSMCSALPNDMPLMGGEVGIFWIEMTEIYKYFCEIDVCKYRPEWRSTSMESKLPACAPNQYSLLSLHVPTDTEVNVCVYQETPRGSSAVKNLVDLGALVLHYPTADSTSSSSLPLPISCSLIVGSQLQSIVSGSGFLGTGNYAILPIAFNHWAPPVQGYSEHDTKAINRKNDRDCVVSVFSSKRITYDEHVLTRPGYLAESLFLLIENTKPKSQPYPGMLVYEVCLKHGCRIMMAVNKTQHDHFTVACNALESQNIVSTRGTLHTVDCIPPMHRQVLLVLTQLEPSEAYSIFMRIEFHQSRNNRSGVWGAIHQPELYPSIHELHSPRLC